MHLRAGQAFPPQSRAENLDYIVELDFEGPGFVAVPNHVVDDERLSADALAVLVYLARLSGGRRASIVRVGAICGRFGFGKDKWQRIARELRAAGALADNFGRSSDGVHIVRSLVVGWPRAVERVQPVSRKNRRTGCEPEKPAFTADNPAEVCRKTPPLKRDKTAARGGYSAAKPRAAGASVEKSVNAGRFASSRVETARPASSGASVAVDRGGVAAPAAAPALFSEEKARRAAFVAGLGLPVRDPSSGVWQAASLLIAESGGGR